MKHHLLMLLLLTTLLASSAAFAAKPDSSGEKKKAKGKDRETPVIFVPNDMAVEATDSLGATVYYQVTATDNVDQNPTITCNPVSGSRFPLGMTQVNCIASDWKNNASSESFEVSVVDSTAPTLLIPANMSLLTSIEAGALVSYSVTAHDAVSDNLEVNCSPVSDAIYPIGSTLVECSVADDIGNLSEGSFTVQVGLIVDTDPPEIVVPADVVKEAESPEGTQPGYVVSAIDNVDGEVDVNCSPDTTEWFPLGETQVICNSSDSLGNTSVTSFLVTVVDTQAPILEMPNSILHTTNAEGMNIQFEVAAVDLVDAEIEVVCDSGSGSWFVLGETLVTCTARDSSGNQSADQFQVTLLTESNYTSENGSFTLHWDAPTLRVNGEPLLEGELHSHRIRIVGQTNGWDEEVVVDAPQTSYDWTSPGSDSYDFTVSAIDVFGWESEPSNGITGLVP